MKQHDILEQTISIALSSLQFRRESNNLETNSVKTKQCVSSFHRAIHMTTIT